MSHIAAHIAVQSYFLELAGGAPERIYLNLHSSSCSSYNLVGYYILDVDAVDVNVVVVVVVVL